MTGAPVVQAYGLQGRTRGRLDDAIQPSTGPRCARPSGSRSCSRWRTCSAPCTLGTVIVVGAINGAGLGPQPGRADRVPVPRQPAAAPDLGAERDPRPDADRHRRVAQDPGRPGHADRRGGAGGRGRRCPSGALAVDLDGVRFAYRTGDEVLRGIDLHLPAGTSVAVVGETGSGKTTIAKLLCRLADPTDGRRAHRRRRSPHGRPRLAAPGRAHGPAGRLPVRHHARRERVASVIPARPTTSSGPPSPPSGSAGGSTTCPAGSTPTSASGAGTCPSASASWWRSPGRSSAIRGC